LNPGQPQPQAQHHSQAASSWEQPAHLMEPATPPITIPPQPAIALAYQTWLHSFITNAQHAMLPYLTVADIARLSQINQIFSRDAIPARPISAYTYQDINSISLNPAGTLFLNTLIASHQLTTAQLRFLDGDHINQLNQQNTVAFQQAISTPYDILGSQAQTPSDQIHNLDMLHLHYLGTHTCQNLQRQGSLTGLQRDFVNTRNLMRLVAETRNLDFPNIYIGNAKRSSGLDEIFIKQLFILAAATGKMEYLPGLGAMSCLDAAVLSHTLPSGVYVVTQLFSQFGPHNALLAPDTQVVALQNANAVNLCGGIQGDTLGHISVDAFHNLADYVNTHNTHIYFTQVNLMGLGQERFLQISDETLLQALIQQQFPSEHWRNYFQSHHEINSWGGLVTWLNEYNAQYRPYSPQQLNQLFTYIADFVRHRLTILQDIYNSLTDEQKAMFGDALGYHGEGGRRTQQLENGGAEVLQDVTTKVAYKVSNQLVDIEDNQSTKASLTSGSVIKSHISGASDHDWFKVTLDAGKKYEFDVASTSNKMVMHGDLRNGNGNLLTKGYEQYSGIDKLFHSKFQVVGNSQTCYLDVSALSGIKYGDYTATYHVI
jgi:hypothetical protein